MREETSGYWIGRRYQGGMLWYDRNWHLLHGWKDVTGPIRLEMQKDTALTKEAFDFKQVGGEMFITTEFGVSVMNLKTLTRTLIRCPSGNPIMRLRTIVAGNDGNWRVCSADGVLFVLFDPMMTTVHPALSVAGGLPVMRLSTSHLSIRGSSGQYFCDDE